MDDQRDYSEEASNRAEMEEGDICTENHGHWVSGMCYVAAEDVESVYRELQAKNISRDIECDKCGGVYVPGKSFDIYA